MLRLVRGVSLPICSGDLPNFFKTRIGTRVSEGFVGPTEMGGPEGHPVGVDVTPWIALFFGGVSGLKNQMRLG